MFTYICNIEIHKYSLMNLSFKNNFTFILIGIFTIFLVNAQKCNIVVKENGIIEIHSEANITFFGDLTNKGQFETRNNSNTKLNRNLINDGKFKIDINNPGGQVTFENPNEELSITGSKTPEFSDLVVNVNNGLQTKVPVDIKVGLLFENGIITTPRNSVDFPINLLDNAIYVGSENTRNIDGYATYSGDLEYTFPIGDDTRLRTLSIESGASKNTTKAGYFYESPDSSVDFPFSLDRDIREDGIYNISSFEFWDLDGNIPTKATLTWDIFSNISQILDSQPLVELTVVGWSKSKQEWVNLGNTDITGNLSVGTITSNSFTPNDYEAITFAVLGDVLVENLTDLIIYNGLSIGDDNNKNDYFTIENIKKFPNNTLKIFNRWGVKVYDVDGYDADNSKNHPNPKNAFRGRSNGRITIKADDLLPVGTYYYILNYEVDTQGGQKTKAGYLYINR